MSIALHIGDCRMVLREFAEASIDACVTDPPYELKFMGKSWDGTGVAFQPETWCAVYRVLKPGGHLLAMGGTRTYHRLACAIEDAGFEIRDTISWLYGSGFPKSHDVSKGIDRAAGAEREAISREKNWGASKLADGKNGYGDYAGEWAITTPATDAARQWAGWGTALKPACELIVLARKPLSEGTVAANVLRWGTGAINVDGCRVDNGIERETSNGGMAEKASPIYGTFGRKRENLTTTLGRWPANVAHDGSDEVTAAFPDVHGAGAARNGSDNPRLAEHDPTSWTIPHSTGTMHRFGDEGSAARFFYTAKADADDRLGSKHPTVKPLDLMQWLVRLVTPKRVTYCPHCEGDHASEIKKTSSSATVQGMRNDIQTEGQSACGPILQPAMRGESTRIEAGAVPMVQHDIPTAQGRSADVLQQAMFEQSGSETPEIDARFRNDKTRVQDASHADASSIPRAGGLYLRTPMGDGTTDRSDANEERSSTSHQRDQGRQPTREFTTDVEGRPRQAEPPASEHTELSALQRQDCNQPTCPSCGTELKTRPGRVLDCFAGTGTTGEAAWREGMSAVLIEAEPEYQADIRRRMALVLAGPDERMRESIKAKNLPRDDGPLFADRETWAEMWAKPFDFSQEPKP